MHGIVAGVLNFCIHERWSAHFGIAICVLINVPIKRPTKSKMRPTTGRRAPKSPFWATNPQSRLLPYAFMHMYMGYM